MTLEGIAFHGKFESRKRMIPLLANEFQRPTRLLQLRRLELPQALPPNLDIAHQSRSRQYPQVLRDGLPRNVRPERQVRDGHGAAHTQGGDEPKSRLIAQRGKERRVIW